MKLNLVSDYLLKKFETNEFIWVQINDYTFYYDYNIICLQACYQKGIYLPRFCYHAKLKLSGNCRLCFIEDSETVKPIISCAVLIVDEMEIFTHTQIVFNAREGVLELLLINHPLDCPICDQGGECDLQDQFMVFGNIVFRYTEKFKKNILDKDISLLIKINLNKCINCSRCVRFAQDIIGFYNFSLLGRGEFSEISNYNLKSFFFTNLLGNIIDSCPVGALTSKFYSFRHRFWELIDVRLIDIFDVFHTFIRLDFRGISLIRIISATNEFIEEEWISDNIRFSFDAFNKQRLLVPFYKVNNFYFTLSWLSITYYIKNYLLKLLNFFFIRKMKNLIHFLYFSSFFNDYLLLNFVKMNFNKLNWFNTNFHSLQNVNNDFRENFYLNNSQLELNNEVEFCNTKYYNFNDFLMIGYNFRLDLFLFDVKMREKVNFDYITINIIGFITGNDYFYSHCGNNLMKIFRLIENKLILMQSANMNLILGSSFYQRFDYFGKILNSLNIFKRNYMIFKLFLINNTELILSEVGSILKKFKIIKKKFTDYLSFSYNFNTNNVDVNILNYEKSLHIYQGHHGGYLANFANIFLPSRFYYEKSFVYLNIFGLLNNFIYSTYKFFINNIKTDWKIFKTLFEALGFNIKNFFFFFKNNVIIKENDQSVTNLIPISLNNFNNFNELFVIYKFSIFVTNFVDDTFNAMLKNSKILKKKIIKLNFSEEVSKIWTFEKTSNYFVK